ncbi:hypothetical protein IWX90DRAFT_249603 [Phyllosticta citrichinensis]|uniref:Uncharacterized protein n=1 Tax=Phyllosticta citrichinensis TaxID=1130410 RepID=A0ABR1XQW5_9PEZI
MPPGIAAASMQHSFRRLLDEDIHCRSQTQREPFLATLDILHGAVPPVAHPHLHNPNCSTPSFTRITSPTMTEEMHAFCRRLVEISAKIAHKTKRQQPLVTQKKSGVYTLSPDSTSARSDTHIKLVPIHTQAAVAEVAKYTRLRDTKQARGPHRPHPSTRAFINCITVMTIMSFDPLPSQSTITRATPYSKSSKTKAMTTSVGKAKRVNLE